LTEYETLISFGALLSTGLGVLRMQKELDQLESEREQLRTKLSKLQSRVKSETDASAFQEILAATSALRKGTASDHLSHRVFFMVVIASVN
jgi:hypothetical protein